MSGDMASTRSPAFTWRRDVKPSNVACLSPAVREASLGSPVVPEVRAISTTRDGSGGGISRRLSE
jgi:hypothetical protein